ncbi:MAG: hypothetical protein EXS03_01715 [Phycisphaerales bacterium]|nr:hypothetical protein [Phycisphaerales bacterium]
MTHSRGLAGSVAEVPQRGRTAQSQSDITTVKELLCAARAVESALRQGAREVAEHAAAQGRVDALEAVTGHSSLDRAALEIAELIRQIEDGSATAASRDSA